MTLPFQIGIGKYDRLSFRLKLTLPDTEGQDKQAIAFCFGP
jgi:hypothetical protein